MKLTQEMTDALRVINERNDAVMKARKVRKMKSEEKENLVGMLDDAIVDARMLSVSWDRIGKELGMSSMVCWRNFHNLILENDLVEMSEVRWEDLKERVHTMRLSGHTWQQIADELNVNMTKLFNRFRYDKTM
jgi:hypothetical protein